ncbi:hypothetical protein [Companilactobacillus farciminis]|nr:hypothetical protein [Companilactobacillus farciminis]
MCIKMPSSVRPWKIAGTPWARLGPFAKPRTGQSLQARPSTKR